jgi:ABC-type transport system substrate-binding protein
MRSIRRGIEAAAVAASALVLGVGLACVAPVAAPIPAAHPGDATPRNGGTLHLATISDMPGLDPAGVTNGVNRPFLQALYAGLVDYDEHGVVVPDLATRWEVADEGTTYRFFLREGVRFHDGDEVTADDLARSIERALRKESASPQAQNLADLVGFDAFQKGAPHLAGVVVEGRYVVAYKITAADATFPMRLALHVARPVCKSAGDRVSPSWQPCGAGPYELPPDGWQRGVRVRVVRHDGYFRPGLPHLDAIELALGVNPITQRLKFENGDIDIIRDFSGGDVIRYMADERWAPLGAVEPDRIVSGEVLNTQVPPFDDVELRRAVAAAIDRDEYHAIAPPRVTPAHQLIPPVATYAPRVEGQQHDLTAALEHMRRAGYPYDPVTRTGGYPKPIAYVAYYPGFGEYSGQVLQQQLARIGIRLDLRLVSTSAWLTLVGAGKAGSLTSSNQRSDYPDPTGYFDQFTSAQSDATSSSSGSFFRNPSYDDAVERAHHEVDPERRAALFDDANRILCQDAPWAITHFYHYYFAHQPYVGGFRLHPVWSDDFRFVWLDRAGDRTALLLFGSREQGRRL